jgi:hypothetical protein
MLPHEILDAMYASEINCRIESFYDGGWVGWLGDNVNGFPFALMRGKTFDECVRHLAGQACSVYPMSVFANAHRGKF